MFYVGRSETIMAINDDVLYRKSYTARLKEMGDLAPDAVNAFHTFSAKAMAPGRISGKTKELIAVAVSHVTGCPYCIEKHVGDAKRKYEVSKEEMAEAIMVATYLKAGSSMAHGVNALNAYDETADDVLYRGSYSKRLGEYSNLHEDAFKAFRHFAQEAMKAGRISAKDKELIGVAVAHVTGCPYCIDAHVKAAKKQGATKEEVAEAVLVATAVKAGSAFAHSINALNAYGE
jgi:AhpD family alkylhydroperoxidase